MIRTTIAALLLCLLAFLPPSVAPQATANAPRQAESESRARDEISAVNWPAYQDQAVQLLQDYIRIDTSNPPGNELRAADFFKKLFDDAGIPNTTYEYLPGRADFYAVVKGDGSLRPIVLLSHMDVVRAQPENWKAPPFSGAIVDGEIYGRGAEDMKDQGLLNAMMLLMASREHLPLKRDLIFLATADEEVNDTGSQWLIEHHPELVRGAEYLITEGGSNLITPDRGLVYGIDVAEKAPFWLRLTATGPGGHGSIPISDSAPNRLVRALYRVVNWETPVHLLPSVEEYFHQLAAREPQPLAEEFRNIRESIKDPAFVKVISSDSDLNYRIRDTVSLTGLQGSPQTNVIPDTATANLDIRLLPGDDPQEFLRELRAVINDDRIRIDPIDTYRVPNASPTGTTLYHVIEQVVHEHSPQALITPELDSGYTENQMYRQLGIVCYGFLPVELTPEVEATEHSANERIPVEQVRRGLKMFYEVIARVENQ
jgi:acetylornithine deacetylase/succinyl-diaminopimelate desuccinylase-like protein